MLTQIKFYELLDQEESTTVCPRQRLWFIIFILRSKSAAIRDRSYFTCCTMLPDHVWITTYPSNHPPDDVEDTCCLWEVKGELGQPALLHLSLLVGNYFLGVPLVMQLFICHVLVMQLVVRDPDAGRFSSTYEDIKITTLYLHNTSQWIVDRPGYIRLCCMWSIH